MRTPPQRARTRCRSGQHSAAPLCVSSPGQRPLSGALRRQRAGYSPWRPAGVSSLRERYRPGGAPLNPGLQKEVAPPRTGRVGRLFRSLRLLMGTEARDPEIMHFYWSLRSRDRKFSMTGRTPHAHWLPEPGSPTFSRHAVFGGWPPLPRVTGGEILPPDSTLRWAVAPGVGLLRMAYPSLFAAWRPLGPGPWFLTDLLTVSWDVGRLPSQTFCTLQEFQLGRDRPIH